MDIGRFGYRTIEEAEGLAYLLAAACPDPDRAAVGLSELLINAVSAEILLPEGWPGTNQGAASAAP